MGDLKEYADRLKFEIMGDLKEYADRLKFEIMAADFLTTEDREMVFDLIEKVLGDDNA